MIYNNLGKSGLKISQLSLGTWLSIGDRMTDKEAERFLTLAYEHGVNFFDNAESYNNGLSELALGRLLKRLNWDRSSYLVSSKVFFGDGGTKPNQTGLSRKHVFECCHAAMKRMQVDYLDLYFCHRPDESTPIEETVWAMNHLIQQGKVLYWGTSEWSALEIMEAHKVAKQRNLIGPTMEQVQYNMFVRDKVESEFVQLFNTYGLGATTWSPLNSGVLTDKYLDKFPKETRLSFEGLDWLKERSYSLEKVNKARILNELAKEIGTTLPKMATAWCAKNPHVSSVILGASSINQLSENLDALNWITAITSEVEEKIEQILNNKPIQASV
ncbi:MAG: aldo/keto reductase [Bacteroidales bacterium]|nr:aldo/keto reductase [Bacteroidales bacterium]